MTDRIKGVWVVFQDGLRDDDAAPVIEAIKQIRHVVAVEPKVSDSNHWMAQMQLRDELQNDFYEFWKRIGRVKA